MGRDEFHLVVQKGRSFQRACPWVPVLLDAGRHLVVAIDPASVETSRDGDYGIEPLGNGRVVHTACPPHEPTTGRLGTPLGPVDRQAFTADLSHLTDLFTRLSTDPLYRQAADYTAGRLRDLGYTVEMPEFAVGTAGSSVNVVGRRIGTGDDRGEILVTAHLDAINHEDGPRARAPGADDNASGSCGALEIARRLTRGDTEHDVTIVLFGGEEQGLYGSRAYVADLSPADRARIRAVLNMDMIGRVNTEPPTVLFEGAPISADLIDRLADAAAAQTSPAVETSLIPYASDHVPFIEAGIPAVLAIEGGDGANDAVHTARDTADRIDPTFAADILTAVGAVVADIAGYRRTPTADGDPS
ncbi:M28 family metallopeptidase [Millisia brevis]|uniref:M28 family metallopeptidase n=1 Tax=Millisia brevis TaxID=264148 RepID=UPI0008375178|nr:M28 family metallopeptidase [Millisia brevis]